SLADTLDALTGNIRPLERQTCNTAPWSCQSIDIARANRVSCHREHDRDHRCGLLCCGNRTSSRDYDINLETHELGRDLGITLGAALGPSILDRDSATLDPAKFAQSLHKRADPLSVERRRARAQVPNGRQLPRL